MWPTYAQMAYNNTYGIKAINESQAQAMTDAWEQPGGCRDQVLECHKAARIGDPHDLGGNDTVNHICSASETFCYNHIMDGYRNATGRNYFDISTFDPASTPPSFLQGFLSQSHIQEAIGVPLNWTLLSGTTSRRFKELGEYPRDASLENMAYLLDNGIKVALMYGDRDFACNWYGGEQVSLGIPHKSNASFHAAGYTPISTNASYTGGQVRQHGNLSFSRIYEAGHEVPFYQPETAYQVFMRAIQGRDIATGLTEVGASDYATVGPRDTYNITNEPLESQPLSYCYSLSPSGTCTESQKTAIANGSATICSFIMKDRNSTLLFPELMGKLEEPGCRSVE